MKVAFDIIGFSDHGDNFLLCHNSKFCRVILKVGYIIPIKTEQSMWRKREDKNGFFLSLFLFQNINYDIQYFILIHKL